MHEEGYAITEICDILELNRSSYYNWTHRAKSKRETENEALLHEIGLIYAEHNGTYGYRRIADEYNATQKNNTIESVSTVWCILLDCLLSSAESALPTEDLHRKLRLRTF